MAISRLVDANVLRYDAALNVKWDGCVMENEFYCTKEKMNRANLHKIAVP